MEIEETLLQSALTNGFESCLAYANWLVDQGRELEAEVWRKPQTNRDWFMSSVGYVSAFYGALTDPETYKINWDEPLQNCMKPVKHVFLDDEGDQEQDLPWIALVYYDDGEPSPFMFVECLEDCQGAGWFGEAERYDSLDSALTAIHSEYWVRFALRRPT